MNGIPNTGTGKTAWHKVVEATRPARRTGGAVTVYLHDRQNTYLRSKTQMGISPSAIVRKAMDLLQAAEQQGFDVEQLIQQ